VATGAINQTAGSFAEGPGRVRAMLRVPHVPATASRRAGVLPWVPLWLSLGIFGWFSLAEEPGAFFYITCAALGIGALALWQAGPGLAGRLGWGMVDRLRIAALAMLFIALGAVLSGLRSDLVAAPVLGFRYYGAVEGRVVEIDRSSRDRMRLTLDRVVLDDVAPARVPKRVRISLIGAEQQLPVPGQRVMLTAHLGPPGGPAEPGGFDFRRLAWFEGLGAIGYARTPVVTVEPPRAGGALALHRLRMRLSAAIQNSIGGQAGAVSAALMTGDRSAITEATNDVMRASNLYHIISISGLHMSMLAGFVYAALRLTGVAIQRLRGQSGASVHKWAAMGALVAAAIYLWLSGSDVATERSFVMIAVMLLAIVFDRRAISLRTVAVAGVVILASTPEALMAPGFQMSFAATVGLILIHEPWRRIAPHLPWWLRPVLVLLISSLVAGLVTAPIAAAHFGRLSQYGTLANLLVVPVAGMVVMPAGVVAALLVPLGLHDLALWFMGIGSKWMLLVATWIAGFDGTTALVPAPPRMVLPLMALGAAMAVLAPVGARYGLAGNIALRRAVGLGMVCAGMIHWSLAQRPMVLISPQGDAVGVLIGEGRVPSKPKGGAFVVSEWLQADGDPRDQTAAAARPGWEGEAPVRSLRLDFGAGGVLLHHLTGKRAVGLAPPLCRDGAIIVADIPLGLPAARKGDCTVLDAAVLRATGAVAITDLDGAPHLTTSRERAGNRAWTRQAPSR